MPARKPPVPPDADDPAQSQRFIDMAREVEVDESPGAFDRAFGKVTRPPVPKQEAKQRKPKAEPGYPLARLRVLSQVRPSCPNSAVSLP